MPINQLVHRLARDLGPVRPRTVGRDALGMSLLYGIELVLFPSLGTMRPDLPTAMALPSFWWKLGSLGLIAPAGAMVAMLSLDPVASPRRGLRWLASIVAGCLAVGWIIDASRDGLPALAMRVRWHDGLRCVLQMAVLSVPPIIGLGALMRRGAPTDSGGTAMAAGIAAASWGAFVFVFACPHDDPLYVAVWYAVGCGLVTALARLLLPPLTRW